MIEPLAIGRFPTLRRAMLLTGPRGMCFHRSVALVLDLAPAKLCIGTVRAATQEEIAEDPNVSREPFIHAWTEVGDAVLAPTTIEKTGGLLQPFGKADYYEKNGIRDVRVMTRAEVRRLAREHGWIPHLVDHTPLESGFGHTLLEAAGVRWKDNELGGVVPA